MKRERSGLSRGVGYIVVVISVNGPELAEVKTAVSAALADFHAREQYLLEYDLNERTISHRLAIYLQQRQQHT